MLLIVVLAAVLAPARAQVKHAVACTGASVELLCQTTDGLDAAVGALLPGARVPQFLALTVQAETVGLWWKSNQKPMNVQLPLGAMYPPRIQARQYYSGKADALVLSTSTSSGDLEFAVMPRRPGWFGFRRLNRKGLDDLAQTIERRIHNA